MFDLNVLYFDEYTMCPYCKKAIDLLKSKKLVINNITNVNYNNKDFFKNKYDFYSFPQIFFNGVLIGGYSDLYLIINNGNTKFIIDNISVKRNKKLIKNIKKIKKLLKLEQTNNNLKKKSKKLKISKKVKTKTKK